MNGLTHEQLLLSSLNTIGGLTDDTFYYQSIFLSSVIPDSTNARFLPAIFIKDNDAKLFVKRKITKKELVHMYNAEDHVLIGQSCMINCLKYGSSDWKKANQTIESILELGDNISVSELIQAPTLYPVEDGKYQILTGHRRFFALIYANGYDSTAQFKLYNTKPLLVKVKQFQENASREELPQYGKLMAFESAMSEITTLNTARIKLGLKKLTVKEIATNLGISMGTFDNYNVLSRYKCVITAYESGLSTPFIKVKKMVLTVETEYKIQYKKSVLNLTDKKNIDNEIQSKLLNKIPLRPIPKTYKVENIKSANTIKALLMANIMELETGIDWDNIDWDDHAAVSMIFSSVIEFLENTNN
ncbi:hypothetical protein [Colwellia psychrerythraea]|uniref:ParB domain protein nuclease n=1 Tax=Colwellia psychrerythraea TaxID=28229 RepID=A0A099KZ88_COLPS|nr:hypothetical protein [Colwellia psychrerythraea]KGJ96054.1 ParB domain protein nuclease [Colwellia psychrerythraea]